MMKPAAIAPLATLILSLLAASSYAQGTTVISGIRVVRPDGSTTENQQIVFTDKVITVGPVGSAGISNANHIDGKGLTAYPGLIDAYCLAGVAAPPSTAPTTAPPAAGVQGGRLQGRQRGNQTSPPPPAAPLAFRKATEGFDAKVPALAALRNNGYAAAVFPARGTLTPGTASLHPLLPGDTLAAPILEVAGVPVNTLSRGGGTYPGTLMGAYAYVRQSLWDGIDYVNRKPETVDFRLASLGSAALGKGRIFYSANSANDIDRALRLTKEFDAPLALVGNGTAYEQMAGKLAQAGAVVYLTGDWSPAPALKKAGVTVVLCSNRFSMSASEADELRDQAISLVTKGIKPADLLAMLTSAPASTLGVADKLGDIKAGLFANLVITDGDLFKKETKIRYTFIQGVKVEPTPVKAANEPKPPQLAADGVPFKTIGYDDADGHKDGGIDR